MKFDRAWPYHDAGDALRRAADLRALRRAALPAALAESGRRLSVSTIRGSTTSSTTSSPRNSTRSIRSSIVLSSILPDPINTYLDEFREGIVDEINGKKIRTLKDVAEAFAENAGILRDEIHRQRPPAGARARRRRGRARAHQAALQCAQGTEPRRPANSIRFPLKCAASFFLFACLFPRRRAVSRAEDSRTRSAALRRPGQRDQSAVGFRPPVGQAPAVLAPRHRRSADRRARARHGGTGGECELRGTRSAEGGQKVPATVEAVDYEANLALLKTDDADF